MSIEEWLSFYSNREAIVPGDNDNWTSVANTDINKQ